MKKFLVLTATLAALALANQAAADIFIIDSFEHPPYPDIEEYSVDRDDPNASGTLNAGGTAIGGYRTTNTNFVSAPGASHSLGGGTTVYTGFFTYSSDTATKINSSLTWNADGAGLGGFNLLAGVSGDQPLDEIGLNFEVSTFDQGSVDFTLNLRDSDGTAEHISLTVLGDGLKTLLFSGFTSALDLSSIDFISIGMAQVSEATDFKINFFEVDNDLESGPDILPTPIPAAIWLFGSGLLGLISFSKRKKAQNAMMVA
jgi:hypothetical protein